MENIISIANCWEEVEIGYVSTHVKINRSTNEILSVSYNWYEEFSTNNRKSFDSFESLNTFIKELIDLKNECELNSLEMNAVSPDFKFETYREELIQSLSTQQLPKEFIPEYEDYDIIENALFSSKVRKDLKTITNSEGKEELVGNYTFLNGG